MDYSPTPQLIAILCAFAAVYLVFVIQKLRRRDVDIYDFFLLLSLAVVPLLFVVWPALTETVASSVGVALPLSLMFGILFVAVFIIIHRLISRLHRVETALTAAVQEIAILEEWLRYREGSAVTNSRLPESSRVEFQR